MDYHLLGLGTAYSLVKSVQIDDMGASVIVHCVYNPLGKQKSYRLLFWGCSQLRIDMMPDKQVHEQDANLLGISLGQAGSCKPAVLTTDLFELHVTYQQFQCIVDGEAAVTVPTTPANRGAVAVSTVVS